MSRRRNPAWFGLPVWALWALGGTAAVATVAVAVPVIKNQRAAAATAARQNKALTCLQTWYVAQFHRADVVQGVAAVNDYTTWPYVSCGFTQTEADQLIAYAKAHTKFSANDPVLEAIAIKIFGVLNPVAGGAAAAGAAVGSS